MPTVIKAHDTNPVLLRRLETVSVADHVGEARLLLGRTREEARRLLHDAQLQAQDIRREAEEQGYEAGFRRGYETGALTGRAEAFTAAREAFAAEQVELIQALTALIDNFEQRKRDLFIAAEQDVVRLAALVAEKVTRQVGVTHPQAAADNLEAALRLVESKTDLTAHVHPAEVGTIERFAESLRQRFDEAVHLRIVADDSVARGGCRLVTPDAEVDATLDTQLAQLAELMVPAPEETA